MKVSDIIEATRENSWDRFHGHERKVPHERSGGLPYWDVQAEAAAFYIACLKAGYVDEATEFAEWFLETFDTDLET